MRRCEEVLPVQAQTVDDELPAKVNSLLVLSLTVFQQPGNIFFWQCDTQRCSCRSADVMIL
jgi:hypothetical protein